MYKKLLSLFIAAFTATSFAAVDVNTANPADLDSIKGIGPGTSTKILEVRKNGKFKDWSDLIERMPGIGEKRAAKLSSEGLTVNGVAHQATSTPAKPRLEKAATKATSPAAGASQ